MSGAEGWEDIEGLSRMNKGPHLNDISGSGGDSSGWVLKSILSALH